MSNLTANNLSVSGNITCGPILSSSNIQTTGNLICNDLIINGTGNFNFNNLNFTGLINNSITTSNLLSLDTTTSIQTSLNTINSNISSIQTQQQTDINSINNLNSEVAILNAHYKSDASGNLTITTNSANTNISMANGNGQELSLYNGTLNLTNNDTTSQIQFQVFDNITGDKVFISPTNGAGAYNSITPTSSSVIASNIPLCLFQNGSSPSGLILSQNYAMLGSGSVTGTNVPSNYFYIDASGIGLNIQTPSHSLDINGTIATNTGLYIEDTNTKEVQINFGSYTDGLAPSYSCNKIDLYNQQKNYGFGIASNTLIYNSLQNHSFYSGSTNTAIGTQIMNVDLSGVIINGELIVNNNNILNSINSIQTQQTTNTNYINSVINNLKNISGNIELISSNSASNYIYVSGSGIGINKNSGISNTLDINGDISITNGSIGSIGSYLVSLNNNITNLTNQLNTLITHSAKAYGYYNSSTNTITNSYNIKTSLPISYGSVQNNITGILIVLQNFSPYQGICIATPDLNGYTCQTNYDGGTGSFIVGVQNGGSAPSFIQASFSFVIY